ncbi:unnamed protein product [Miscanthus lutarioriparius]|uniref:Uncharacterized protein n=1 Tax=Miscanthus lutarioriparius TaxID=422564 RepID=A0A811PBX6_9POAL|nr:unnamed protein product [Miscanthus lutarioriparius]
MSLLATATPTTSSHFPAPPPSFHMPRRNLTAPVHRIRRSRLLTVVASVPDPSAGPVEYTPWLFAGLGNPGNKYYGTRHNVGFEMVDRIAGEEGITMNTIQSKSLLGIVRSHAVYLVLIVLPRPSQEMP